MIENLNARAGDTARVFLVHQATLTLVALEKILAGAPGLEVIGSARNGAQALPLIAKLRPDVICLEAEMPIMDGLELTRQVMGQFPTPILVLESATRIGEASSVAAILEAGALDKFPLPRETSTVDALKNEFTAQVRRLSRVPVISRRPRLGAPDTVPALPTRAAPPLSDDEPREVADSADVRPADGRPVDLVVIGSSTGGPQVLLTILTQLPADYPRAVLCVQHISKGFLSGMVDWLNSQCAVTVKIGQSGEIPRAGHVYFAEEDHHLELDARCRLRMSSAPPVGGHRPAVTVLFESAARSCGARSTGILLTGMGTDGALGLAAMARAGSLTIAQNEASCVVFGMPRQAIALGAAKLVLSPIEIARKMLTL